MEFFIACGDAMEGFKAGEEILNVVAFNVDVFVEGRLDGAIGASRAGVWPFSVSLLSPYPFLASTN